MELSLPAGLDDCGKLKRVILGSTDPDFPGRPYRLKVKKGSTTLLPKPAKWLKLLKIGGDGSRIYLRASCAKASIEEDMLDFLVEETEASDAAGPDNAADLTGPDLPIFSFDPGSGVKWWIEFSPDDAFTKPVRRLRAKQLIVPLKKGAWKSVRKKLEKAGAGGTGWWRVVCRDVLKRTKAGEPRSFTYSAD